MYSARDLVLKRALDVAVSVAGLVAAGPVMAVTAVLIKLSSPGPILFRQQRIGRYGRSFALLKFRSMRVGEAGPLVTSGFDHRITPIGRALRRSKLDELPQLLNVARGELSLVGPRPEVARYVALYAAQDREFLQRFRPGITDPATIRFRNEEEILGRSADPELAYIEQVLPAKVSMYRSYLEAASFVSDIKVLADTLKVLVKPSLAGGI